MGVLYDIVRISFNGKTSAFQADDAGSIPAIRSKKTNRLVSFFIFYLNKKTRYKSGYKFTKMMVISLVFFFITSQIRLLSLTATATVFRTII